MDGLCQKDWTLIRDTFTLTLQLLKPSLEQGRGEENESGSAEGKQTVQILNGINLTPPPPQKAQRKQVKKSLQID